MKNLMNENKTFIGHAWPQGRHCVALKLTSCAGGRHNMPPPPAS